MPVSMATRLSDLLTSATVASREVRGRFAEQTAQRQAAASRILGPDDVAGDYDAGRLLSTTLGGQLRAVTADDLVRFKRTAEALGKRFVGGITAKSVIDHSFPIDRERANREIRVAVPVQRMGNDVHFITNAGPRSDVTRHHVHVQFLALDVAIASPSKAADMVKTVIGGKIRMQCDCDRWRFLYRYMATVGRYNAGRPETGFPKITNPTLGGVACKHVLRVMNQLSAPVVRSFIEKMIMAGRREVAPKLNTMTKKAQAEMAALQQKQAHHLRNTVESSLEKRTRLAQQRKVREIAERNRQAIPKDPRKLAAARRKFEESVRLMVQMGGITQKQGAALLAKVNGQQS